MSERAEASGAAFWGDADETEALYRYQRLVNAVSYGIYQFDADSRVELLGYNVRDLHPDPDSRAEFSRQLVQEGRAEDVEPKQETIGGEIWIEPESGDGAIFSFTLPAVGDDGE